MSGGEALSPSHVNRLVKTYPHVNMLNGYGPTENSTYSTTFNVDKEYEGSIPIGYPLQNSSAYVLDAYMNLQPVGIAGELYLGGDGVARGYLNAPELTISRFTCLPETLVTPVWPAGTRIYSTGDYARWMPGGYLDFLGRIDNQVKIRGYRIELDEIRERLLKHEGVRDALALVLQDASHEKFLTAYIVAANPSDPVPASELKSYLAKGVPEYMVPPHFLFIDKVPVTSRGKLDRRALPLPKGEIDEEYVAPENEIQQKLAAVWAELLDLDPSIIGINDNFFARGGHSLKATVMTARLEKMFGVHLPLAEILRTPTIKEISALLEVVDWAHEDESDSEDDDGQSVEITI
jgi:acyl-coenzyme A synthetase/AMP-(fatty) acid ligase/acyl carrier protein